MVEERDGDATTANLLTVSHVTLVDGIVLLTDGITVPVLFQ